MSTDKIITVRPKESFISKQQLPNFEGISAQSAGTAHLCMHLVVIPPGGRAVAHYHDGHETTIYIIKGRAETKYGDKLEQSSINEAGDFIFIPPNVPHQPINLSDTEEVIAVVARNDPNEQESVVLYNP
jgi:uncharacterized RmlC-like cupin family protein